MKLGIEPIYIYMKCRDVAMSMRIGFGQGSKSISRSRGVREREIEGWVTKKRVNVKYAEGRAWK